MAGKLSDKQAGALELDKNFSIVAGAGSGKTTVIIEKIFNIITSGFKKSGMTIRQLAEDVFAGLLCITFTNKAANELYERIGRRLNEESGRIKSDAKLMSDVGFLEYVEYIDFIYENVDKLNIMTMDAFFAKILRNNAIELNLSSDFQICDGGLSQIMFKDAVDEVIASITGVFEEKKYAGLSDSGEKDDRIWKLNHVYRVYNDRNSMFEVFWGLYGKNIYLSNPAFKFKTKEELKGFLNCEISDKSMVLNEYYRASIWGDAEFIDAFEELFENENLFTGKSLEKVKDLSKIYHDCGPDKKNAFFDFLLNEYRYVKYPVEPENLKDKITYFRDLAKEVNLNLCGCVYNISEFEYDFLKSFLELFDEVRNKYNEMKETENLLDFYDVEHILRTNPRFLDVSAGDFTQILIDEFQDTNVAQVEMITRLWTKARLTIVGDGMQSIYRFRNADSSLFRNVTGAIIERGGKKISLDENYRSAPNVLEFINLFFNGISGIPADSRLCNEMPLELISRADPEKIKNNETAVEIALISSVKADGKIDVSDDSDSRTVFENSAGNEDDEIGCNGGPVSSQYEFIARRVKYLITDKGYKYNEIMILLSRMTHVSRLEECLKSNEIPYYIYKSRNFYKKTEIYDFLNFTRAVINPDDNYSLTGVLRSPIFAIPDYAIFEVMNISSSAAGAEFLSNKSLFQKLEMVCRGGAIEHRIEPDVIVLLKNAYLKLINLIECSAYLKPAEFFAIALDELNIEACYGRNDNGARAAGNIKKLVEQAGAAYNADTLTELTDIVEAFIELSFSEEESQIIEDDSNTVKIMTVHQAKGLESKVVIIPELEVNFNRGESVLVNSSGFVSINMSNIISGDNDEGGSSDNSISCLEAYHEIISRYEKLQNLFERKRLFYVAMTRAKEYLIMTGTFDSTRKSNRNINLKPPAMASSWLDWVLKVTGISLDDLNMALSAPDGIKKVLNDKNYRLFAVVNGNPDDEPMICRDNSEHNENKDSIEILNYKKEIPETSSDKYLPILTFSELYKNYNAPLENVSPGEEKKDFYIDFSDYKIYGTSRKKNAGSFIGTMLHRALEEIIKRPELLEEKNIFNILLKCNSIENAILDMDIKTAGKYLSGFIENLKCAVINDSQVADIVLNKKNDQNLIEHEVFLNKYGVKLTGICDLIKLNRSELKIIDFKTGNGDEIINDIAKYNLYKNQLYFYGYCLLNDENFKNFEGIKVKYYLMFLSSDPKHTINLKEIEPPSASYSDEIIKLYDRSKTLL